MLSGLVDIVAFIDPASGRKSAALKRNASRSADLVVGRDDLGRIFVLHAWAGRIPTTTHTDRIFALNQQWHPRIIGIDASAMQSLYADALTREAKQKAERLPLQPIGMPTTVDKDSRIRAILQPVIAMGRLFLLADQRDLHQELEAFPHGLTKDLVDALSQAIALLKPVNPKRMEDADREARLAYLRETNAPGYYIDAVARGA